MVKSKKIMWGLDCVDFDTQVFTDMNSGFDVIQLACPRKISIWVPDRYSGLRSAFSMSRTYNKYATIQGG